MNTQIERPSARIYQFPVQPRFGSEAASPPVRIAGFGDSWYHEAAVRDADQTKPS